MSTFGACIPNYNYAKYLPRCLESLASQTRPLDELVVVDDASTDNSIEIIESYRPRFKKMVVVRNQHNLGVSNSVNKAWSLCTTEYAKTMPSDDWLAPEYFEKLARLLELHPKAHVACSSCISEEEETGLKWIAGHLHADKPKWLSEEEITSLDQHNRLAIYGITMLVRTARLRELGGEDVRLLHSSDTFLWLSLMFPGGLCYDPAPLAFCRVSSQTFSAQVVADNTRKHMALAAFMEKLIVDGSPELQGFMRKSAYMVHAGKVILPTLLKRPYFWQLLTFTLLRRYIVWNWWRVCDRYLRHPWLRWLQPNVPVLQRVYISP